MRQHTLFFLLLLFHVFGLSACATLPSLEPTQKSVETQSPQGVLPPQTLASGQCGLFVWTAGQRQKFVGFETNGTAKYILNNLRTEAVRSDAGALDSASRQYVVSETGQTFNLSLEPDREIAEGQRFNGQLSSKTAEGWDRLMPVVALLNCRAA
jgi:hypothetical protein